MVSVIYLTCPSCGARLNYTGGERLVNCQYCGGNFPIQNELNDRIKRGFQLIAQSMYSQAVDILNEAAVIDPHNGRIFFGLLLCDLRVNSPAKLANASFDFTRMPNYVNAIAYLDQESRAELEQLAIKNKENLSVPKAASSYPTPLMNEFTNANNYTIQERSTTYIALIDATKHEPLEKRILVFGTLKDGIEKTFELYKKLTDDEKRHLAYFDNNMALRALEAYEQFKKEVAVYNEQKEEQARLEAEEEEKQREYRKNHPINDWLNNIDDDEDEDDDEEEIPEPTNAKRGSASASKITIKTYNYHQLNTVNVMANVNTNGNVGTITFFGSIDEDGVCYNHEGYQINIIGKDGVLYLNSFSKSGVSRTSCSLGSNVNVSGVVITGIGSGNTYNGRNGGANMSNSVIGGIASSANINGNQNVGSINIGGNSKDRCVVISGVEYRNNFEL